MLVIGLVVWTLRRRPVPPTEWVLLSDAVIFWFLPPVDVMRIDSDHLLPVTSTAVFAEIVNSVAA